MSVFGPEPSSNIMGRVLARVGRVVTDAILPPTCLVCRIPIGEQGGLCPKCWTQAGFIERPYCERLGTPFAADYGGELVSPAALADPPSYARARAAARYSDVARELIHLMKYGDRMDLVQSLGGWMARAGSIKQNLRAGDVSSQEFRCIRNAPIDV